MNAFLAKKNRLWSFAIACTAVLALLTQSAGAANLTWNNGAATGNWNTTDANWTGSTFTNGGVDNVFFTGTAPGTVTIAANMNPASINVSGSNNYTFTGGPISGSGALNKSGSGSLTLLSPNSFTGGINFAGGEIIIDNANQLGSGTALINVTANSMLTVTNPSTNGTTVSNPMTIAAGTVMTFNRGASQPSPNYSGKISGLGSLEITKTVSPGGNSWTFSNATNDFAGNISILGGLSSANFSVEGAMGGATTITVQTAGGGFGTGSTATGLGLTLNYVSSGSFNNNGGTWKGLVTGGSINVSNAGFDNAANSMSAVTMSGVNLGQLRIGVAGSIGTGAFTMDSNDFNTIVFTDASGGTYNNTLNLSSGLRTLTVNQAAAVINYTGAINATGNDSMTNFSPSLPPVQIRAIIKDGAGTFITNNWNVSNQLSVNAGKFLFNDATTSNLSNIIVANGATFGGNGSVVLAAGKSLTVNGTLQPGSNGAGTLSISGPLNLASTTLLDYQLGTSGNDLVQVTGNLTLDGSLQVTPNGTFGQYGSSYTLFTYSGTLTNNGLNLINLPDAVLDFSIAGQVRLLIPIPTPEPATAWLIGLPALVFARKLRRNRK